MKVICFSLSFFTNTRVKTSEIRGLKTYSVEEAVEKNQLIAIIIFLSSSFIQITFSAGMIPRRGNRKFKVIMQNLFR